VAISEHGRGGGRQEAEKTFPTGKSQLEDMVLHCGERSNVQDSRVGLLVVALGEQSRDGRSRAMLWRNTSGSAAVLVIGGSAGYCRSVAV
jgi:hypothetical protein